LGQKNVHQALAHSFYRLKQYLRVIGGWIFKQETFQLGLLSLRFHHDWNESLASGRAKQKPPSSAKL